MFVDKIISKNVNLIEVNEVSTKINEKLSLNNISFSINHLNFVCLGGDEDSGNSAMIKILCGLIKISKGKIIFKKKPFFTDLNINNLYNYFGYASSKNTLYNNMTIKENLKYFGTLYGLKKTIVNQNIENLLKLIKIENYKDTKISDLSQINVKKANIACSLILNPKILFLDHFTSELDFLSRREIFKLLKELNKTAMTIIIADSDFYAFENYFDHLIIFNKGKITYNSNNSKKNLKYGIVLKTSPGAYENFNKELLKLNGVEKIIKVEDKIKIILKQDYQILKQIINLCENYDEKIIQYYFESFEVR